MDRQNPFRARGAEICLLLFGLRAVCQRLPEFFELFADKWIQLLRELHRQLQRANQFLNVGKISQATRISHSRGELDLNERNQPKISNPLDDSARFEWIGECYRYRLAVSRDLSLNNKLNSHSSFHIA